jgi:hypothetical protein
MGYFYCKANSIWGFKKGTTYKYKSLCTTEMFNIYSIYLDDNNSFCFIEGDYDLPKYMIFNDYFENKEESRKRKVNTIIKLQNKKINIWQLFRRSLNCIWKAEILGELFKRK